MKYEITIQYDDANGALQVMAPGDKQVTCLGMLEKAKDVILSPGKYLLTRPTGKILGAPNGTGTTKPGTTKPEMKVH